MQKPVTKHISIHYNLAKQSSDEDLRKYFTGDPNNPDPAATLRADIAHNEALGIHYFPCGCRTTNPDGSCAGVMDNQIEKTN